MLNVSYLKSKIDEKFQGKVPDFAAIIGVSKQTVYAWLREQSGVEERRIFDIAVALDLTEGETETLLGVPQTILCFRKRGLDAASAEVKEKSRDLANTFFKIDGSSYFVNDTFISGVEAKSSSTAAQLIRQNLQVDAGKPVTFDLLLSELKRHNINVFFIPFRRTGLIVSTVADREVAFTARKGDRIIVFVDTERSRDQSTFDLCHELCHILLGHEEPSKDDERLCNGAAQELIYPKQFFESRKDEMAVFLDTKTHSWNQVNEKFHQMTREFDWSPKGLALALRDYGYIGKDGHEFKRLLTLEKLVRKQHKSMDDLFFSGFNPHDSDQLERFFADDIQKDRNIFRPMIELKDAATFGHLSPRKLAEILGSDSGDTDEIVRSWRTKHEESPDDIDDESTEG